MKRTFDYTWKCLACGATVTDVKELPEHKSDYTMEQVHNLINVTLPVECAECGSMSEGKIIFLKERKLS